GEVVLLENIRFDARETSKVDEERQSLAADLAELADAYVSDGFGVVHRKQASVYDIAKVLPAAVGELVLKEVDSLKKATEDPARPVAVVAADGFAADAPHYVGTADAMPAERVGLDIGPESQKLFAAKLADAKTIVWNGPMGVFEFDAFAGGTRAVAQAMVDAT